MKSKFWVFLSVLVLAAMVLTSCQTAATPTAAAEQPKTEPTKAPEAAQAEPTKAPEPTTAAAPAEPAAAGGPVKITIFVGFGTGTSPEQIAVHQAIQDEYNSTHSDIQIEFVTVPYAERETKFSTMLAGDMAPDIVMPIGVSGVALFFDQWADFTPFIQADNYDMTRFIGKTVETHNYPGKGMLGLPMCVYPTAMYYNVDIFDAAGVEYPPHQFEAAYADGDPWTYDKLREVAALMSLDVNGNNANDANFDAENMKQYGFEFLWLGIEPAIKFGDKWGGVVDTTDYKKSAILDKQFVDYLTWEKDNIWTYHIRANGQQSGAFYDSAGDPFGSGMLAMAETHTWMKYAWSGWSNAFNWDIAAVPQGPNGKILSVVDADTVVMPKAGKHQKEAWEVIKWFFENEQLKKLIDNYGCLPAEQSLADKWVEETKVEFPNQDLQVWLDAMNYLEPGPNHESWTPQWGKINTVVGNAIGQITNGTNLDVSAVLTEADKEIQQILDDYWK